MQSFVCVPISNCVGARKMKLCRKKMQRRKVCIRKIVLLWKEMLKLSIEIQKQAVEKCLHVKRDCQERRTIYDKVRRRAPSGKCALAPFSLGYPSDRKVQPPLHSWIFFACRGTDFWGLAPQTVSNTYPLGKKVGQELNGLRTFCL